MVDSAPWATVTWQTEGQLAYEIEIDGVYYGPYFGAEVRSYTLREPLEDGLHICHVRAQNKYGLWSEWAEANFVTQNTGTQALTLSVEADVDAALTWVGGSSIAPPRIIVQPIDAATIGGLASFAVAADGAGLSYQWYSQEPGSSAWTSLGASGNRQGLTFEADEDMDGYKFRCIVSNAAGSDTSDAATYTYANPSAAPTITVQPETARKTSGTVEFFCGADGTVYTWYHRVIHESGSEDDLTVTDGTDSWRILYDAGTADDIGVTDGTDEWHIPEGSGSAGDLVVEDGVGGAWYMTAGGGGVPEWEPVEGQDFGPFLSFPASVQRSGEQFFCRVYNGAGYTDSEIVQYIYEDEPGEALPGDYYVYRDGELIARRVDPCYTDRTALGTHSYRVLNRLDNNMYQYSNTVTVTITVDTLMIAPLEGGEWLRLCLSDKANREFAFDYSGQVAYIHYSGAKYPEAEVGEQEDLTGTFDVSWMESEMESARAFMNLLRKAVVVKAPNEVVLEGILQGFRRYDPTFYLRYEFSVRQMDWRELDA